MSNVKKLDGFITCISPLVHFSDENNGVDRKLRRLKYMYEGEVEMVPTISGNQIRGILRRIAAADFLRVLGVEKITDKFYYMLFSGGSLEKGSKQDYIEVGSKRELRDRIPFLSLLGCSFKNQIIEGKVKVGMGVPICRETVPYTGENSAISCWDLCDEIFYTRRDDLEDKAEKQEAAQQMKFTVEALCPGTRLKHFFQLLELSEVEESCFYAILKKFNESPFLGGLSSKGHGKVNLGYIIPPDAEKVYYEYLKENKDKILGYIYNLGGIKDGELQRFEDGKLSRQEEEALK